MSEEQIVARLSQLREALVTLGMSARLSELVELAPRMACTIGFDRAILSRVDEGYWLPEAVCVDGDDEWAARILEAGRSHPQRLDPPLIETSILEDPRAMRVDHVQSDPRVNRTIASASLSTSYVVAPLVREGEVIGFLHADRYFGGDGFDAVDLEMLAALAEAIVLALQRVELAERLRLIDELADAPTPWKIGSTHAVAAPARGESVIANLLRASSMPLSASTTHDPPARMTVRETEIVGLVARGLDNQRIAATLTISEETVKSHVKHIFRKLGATSRAEAIARWLGTTETQIPPGWHRNTPTG